MPPRRSAYGVAPRIRANSGRSATARTAGVKHRLPQVFAWDLLRWQAPVSASCTPCRALAMSPGMMKSMSRAGVPGLGEDCAPAFEVFLQDSGYGGAASGAVCCLAPSLESPVAEDLRYPRELALERDPAEPPDLLVAGGQAVLQAHDGCVPVRDERIALLDAQEHLFADRLDGLRGECPAGQRARAFSGRVAGAASVRGSAVAEDGFAGELASVGVDLGHGR
jgi:hypothetical protein